MLFTVYSCLQKDMIPQPKKVWCYLQRDVLCKLKDVLLLAERQVKQLECWAVVCKDRQLSSLQGGVLLAERRACFKFRQSSVACRKTGGAIQEVQLPAERHVEQSRRCAIACGKGHYAT